MEKFQFYLNPVHFFILFFDFKVRLKWGKSKIQKYFSEKKSVFFADLPHNRPFPGLWCKKKFQIDFSQKNDFDLNPVFNPVQPQIWIYEKTHAKDDRLLERGKLLIPAPQIEFELNPKSKKLYEDTWLKSDFFELKQNRITMHIPPWHS